MSTTPIAAAILAALADGPMTTDALIEETGFERPAIVQTLAQLKHERQAYPGRGGWRAGERATPRVKGTRQATKPTTPTKARAAKRTRSAPRRARSDRPVETYIPMRRGAKYVFGVNERGELTITDYAHPEKHFTLNPLDTAGLARCLERWAPMLAKIREAA